MRIRKPRVRISSKGVRVTNVGARIGTHRAGINVSRRGISSSLSGKGWSYNTRRGFSLNPFACCSVLAVLPVAIIGSGMLVWLMF